MERGTPIFKIGDTIAMLPSDKRFYHDYKKDGKLYYDASMLEDYEIETIVGEAEWYPYENHPNGGYWQYPLSEKANNCPEDFLALYSEEIEYYEIPKAIK